jgi:transcription antitermination factor NusG
MLMWMPADIGLFPALDPARPAADVGRYPAADHGARFKALQDRVAIERSEALQGRRWYLVHSYSSRIAQTREHLRAVGYTVYYPMLRSMKTPPRDKLSKRQRAMIGMLKRPVLEPLFQSYLFMLIDLRTDPWRDVFRIVGVSGLACIGDQPWPVPQGFVEGIQKREQGGALPHNALVAELLGDLGKRERMIAGPRVGALSEGLPPFFVGEAVRITAGAFAGVSATVDAMPSDQEIGDLDESARVALLAHLFGRSVRVEVELRQIRKT